MFWHVPVPSGKQKTLSGSVPRIRNKKATLCGQMEPQWTTQVSNALSLFRNKIIMLYEVFPVKCFQRYVLGGEKLSIAHPKMKKREEQKLGMYSKSIANFEACCWNISLRIYLFISYECVVMTIFFSYYNFPLFIFIYKPETTRDLFQF